VSTYFGLNQSWFILQSRKGFHRANMTRTPSGYNWPFVDSMRGSLSFWQQLQPLLTLLSLPCELEPRSRQCTNSICKGQSKLSRHSSALLAWSHVSLLHRYQEPSTHNSKVRTERSLNSIKARCCCQCYLPLRWRRRRGNNWCRGRRQVSCSTRKRSGSTGSLIKSCFK